MKKLITLVSLILYTLNTQAQYDTCIAHLMKYEGFRSKSYIDSDGYPTIGYGHHFKSNEKLIDYISKNDAIELLKKDFNSKLAITKQYTNLEGNKLYAIALFVYNMGISQFLNSSVYKLIKANKDPSEALLKYTKHYINGKLITNKKLIERRKFEIWLYKCIE